MNQAADVWYVRLPDGRVLRAASTVVLRQHLGAGRIPGDSRVRRSPDEEWVALDWTEEFADLVRQKNGNAGSGAPDVAQGQALIASRHEGMRLPSVGLQGMAEELLAALDNTLARSKLSVACVAGVLGGAIVATAGALGRLFDVPWPWLPQAIAAGGLLIIAVICDILLTQMTYTELSRLRPARWVEARAGLFRFSIRLLLAALIAGGGAILAIVLLRRLPSALMPQESPDSSNLVRDFAAEGLRLAALLIEVVCWPVLGFTLLLGPVIVVEESPVVTALGQWWWLIRRHLGRLLLYESVALLGGVAMLVFAVPLVLAASSRIADWGNFDTSTGFSLWVLAGLGVAPLLAYLAVAHVFIYLNLRYEYDNRRK
jgi:hypothetical protein